MQPIISFAIAFILTVAATPAIRSIARRRGWIANPSADRWHRAPTALMGGIAIYFGMIIPLCIVSDWHSLFAKLIDHKNNLNVPSLAAGITIGATIMFALGFVDDLRNLKPQTKLIGQIVAASFITFLGFRLHWFSSLTLDTMVTLFWIVGLTNAFNLMDNMDGLCAGISMVAALCAASVFAMPHEQGSLAAVSLAGAAAGFLVYNFNPASIFMGDCGSLVIGFSMACLALYSGQTHAYNPIAAVAVPVLLLLVPILDTTLVTAVRLLSGRKASTGGKDHTSHRLVLMGFSEKSAVLFLYMVGVISGVAALFVSRSNTISSPAVIIPVVLAIILMGVYLSQLRVYPEKEFSVLRKSKYTPVLIELTYKRQMLMVLLDLGLIAFSYYLSYRLRFEYESFVHYFNLFLRSLPAVIGCKLVAFFLLGAYRGIWRYLSTSDVFLLIRASTLATIISIAVVTLVFRFQGFSKGIFIIDWVVTTGLLLAVRGSFRLFWETQQRKTLSGDKVMIYGAGRAGELLVREIINNHRLSVSPVGFIDDDPLKQGKKIQGYRVFGTSTEVDQIFSRQKVHGVLISFDPSNGKPSSEAAYQDMVRYCANHGLFVKQFSIALKDVGTQKPGGNQQLTPRGEAPDGRDST